MGSDLSLYYNVLLAVWTASGHHAFVPRTFLLTISLVPWMMFVGVPLVDSAIKLISAKDKKLL